MTPKEQAAMQQALEALNSVIGYGIYQDANWSGVDIKKAEKAITALREALAAPQPVQQEPVAWICHKQNGEKSLWWNKNQALDRNAGHEFTPLYAAPVRTKDLTDDEIVKAFNDVVGAYGHVAGLYKIDFARAVIAADREKNK